LLNLQILRLDNNQLSGNLPSLAGPRSLWFSAEYNQLAADERNVGKHRQRLSVSSEQSILNPHLRRVTLTPSAAHAARFPFRQRQRCVMSNLKGSKTEGNLKAAFAGESQANRRYLYFAQKADVEGYNDVAAVFRSTAEGETGHAHGHLEYLEASGDPATGLPFGDTRNNLKAAIAGETHEYTDMYPGMAKSAREEGFNDVADWFETLAKAERSHANRFTKALNELV
jgi:rubrerythrin